MKKGYWVIAYRKAADELAMEKYVPVAGVALKKFGARTLVAEGGGVTPQEAGLKEMTVVIEFVSYEIALAAYASEDYQKALAALGTSVERDFRIVEGG